MFLTEKEIMTQHISLEKTYTYITEKEEEIKSFFKACGLKKFVFMGCGSSYFLAQSAAKLFSGFSETAAFALAGGEYLLNPEKYANLVENSIVVPLTRSGRTSEIIQSIKHINASQKAQVLAVTMAKDSPLSKLSTLELVMEWAYDESVCQTRTVTNIYTAFLLLSTFFSENNVLRKSIRCAIDLNMEYKDKIRPLLKEIALKDFKNIVLLADGVINGLANEGGLAFTEISMLPGSAFCLLDYRHGPIILNKKDTLTIALTNGESDYEKDMIRDLCDKGGTVITVSRSEIPLNERVAAHIGVGEIEEYEAVGIPFLNVAQILSYEKAMATGINPDTPDGLDAFISL